MSKSGMSKSGMSKSGMSKSGMSKSGMSNCSPQRAQSTQRELQGHWFTDWSDN